MKNNLISTLLLLAASMFPLCSYADDGGNKWIVKSVSATAGATEAQLSIFLNNPVSITGVQFDICLPEGVSVKTKRTKAYSIDMGEARYDELDHSLSSSLQDDGVIRVLCVSISNTSIWDDDADGKDIRDTEPLINITLALEDGLSAGTYDIALKNISLTHYDSKTTLYNLDDVFTQLFVKPESGVVESTVDNVAMFASAEGFQVTQNQYQSYVQSHDNLTVVDLRAAELDENFTADGLRQDLGNNALVFLPEGSSISGENIVVDGECTKLNLNDESSFKTTIPFVAATAQYERDLSGIGTICLPFTPDTENFDYYELSDVDASVLNFVKVETPKANTPYLYRKKGSSDVISASNVKIGVEDSQNILKGEWAMVGTHAKQTFTSDEDVYALSSGMLYHNTGMLTISPFRAYFTFSGSGVKEMSVSLNGEATGITLESSADGETGNRFNLSGQAVGRDYKGIVIINGRKEFRK